jgi:hypothetical protein
MERLVLRSISDSRALFGIALLAMLGLGCEDGRCIRHSDCAPTLTCLTTMCVVPPTDADTGVADTAVIDRPMIHDVSDASTGTDAPVDALVDALVDAPGVTDSGLSVDAVDDVAADTGPDAVAAD